MWWRSDHWGKRAFRPLWMGLSTVVIPWWLLLGGAIAWIMPEQIATVAPTPARIEAGMTVRISAANSPPFAIARDRAGLDAMRLGESALSESMTTSSFTSFVWIDVEHGQTAYVIEIDGDAVHIELLDGEHAGERAWIRDGALAPR